MNKQLLTVLIACISAAACLGAEHPQTIEPIDTYGSVIADEIKAVEAEYTFRCHINQWPAIIGRNISVKINAVEMPLIAGAKDKYVEELNSQAGNFIKTNLKQAKLIVLKNIKRGRSFCIIADVYIDGRNLAELLIEKGLAKRTSQEKVAGKEQSPSGKTKIVSMTATTTIAAAPAVVSEERPDSQDKTAFIASKNSKIFHRPTCRFARVISQKNIIKFETRDKALQSGRRPGKTCTP